MKKTLLFIYEPEQVDEVVAYTRAHPETKIIALDFWTERALQGKGIESESITKYCPPWEDRRNDLARAQTIAREWYRIPEMSFFEHAGIRLGQSVELVVDLYLEQVLFYLHIADRVLAAHPDTRQIIVPYSHVNTGSTSGPLAAFSLRAAVDAISYIASSRSIAVETSGMPPRIPEHIPSSSRLRALFLKIYNVLIRIFAPRRKLKILVSDFWWHVEPFIRMMPDAELVFVERSEILNIPRRALWSHRVRFENPSDHIDASILKIAKAASASFRAHWGAASATTTRLSGFSREGLDWWPLVAPAFDYIVGMYAERIIADHEALGRIYEREKINRAIIRASVSGQHHFFLIGEIGRKRNVPVIELQHGIQTRDPNSVFARLECAYIAAYAESVRDVFTHEIGFAPERVRAIGSPRFDHYETTPLSGLERTTRLRSMGLDPHAPVVLFVVPGEATTVFPPQVSSYESADIFHTLRSAREQVPDIQFIFKFRSRFLQSSHRRYLSELFPEGCFLAEHEDLFSLVRLSDAVLVGHSTALYEAMIGGKPIVQWPLRASDRDFLGFYDSFAPRPASEVELASALSRVAHDEAYRAELIGKENAFLRSGGYHFDGTASERMAAFLREDLEPDPQKKRLA